MNLLRTAIERASRRLVLRRQLPLDLHSAPIFVSPDASLRLWKPTLSSDLFDLAREFVEPGHTVWDIGANVGLFMTAAAQRAGPSGSVLAVEPDPWLAKLLQRTVDAQGPLAAPTHILSVAVSNSVGSETLLIAKRGRASNRLSTVPPHTQAGGIRQAIEVPCVTLDSLLDQNLPPNLIKIDVEGSEINLFRGSHRLLSEIQPILMFEAQHDHRPWIGAILRKYNYKLYDWDTHPRVSLHDAAFNTLAIPIKH
jgi:FkbM family methyltransferase